MDTSPAQNTQPALLSDADIEREYGIRRGTMRAWRSRGRGPQVVRLSARYPRYTRESVAAWIAALTESPRGAK